MIYIFGLALNVSVFVSARALAENSSSVVGEAKPSFSDKTPGLQDYKMKKSENENLVLEDFSFGQSYRVQRI